MTRKAVISVPPSIAPVRFLPAPGSSYWAVQWPRIKLWVGQTYSFTSIQEWVCGLRITAWRQPNGRIGIFGDRLEDDYELQYRFPKVKDHEWTQRLYDQLPNKSAVDAYLIVPGLSRHDAMKARKTGQFEVWTMGIPYYRGKSLLWEQPIDGVKIANKLGLDTLFLTTPDEHPQLNNLGMRGKIDYLQREAINQGVEGWLLKNNQGGSRFYVIKPTVSIFGRITGWDLNPGSTTSVASIAVSMVDSRGRWKPVITVRNFPRRIPPLLSEMLSIGILKDRRVEIRAERIDYDGTLVNPIFHRFAGRVTDEMFELANFVSKFKVPPVAKKWNKYLKES